LRTSFSDVRDAVLWAASFLAGKGVENARLEAELLLAKAMGVDRTYVMVNYGYSLEAEVVDQFINLVGRRAEHFPLQYLTGQQEFMSLPFSVEEGVLIPRGDTEVLVEAILKLDLTLCKSILDVGTGSGIIAVSLARYLPGSKVTAVDISTRALDLAKRNAEALGVGERILFLQADVFHWNPEEKYDLIVSNPPYISAAEMRCLQPEVRFEPYEALFGGEKGLDFYFRLAELAAASLKNQGVLAVEIGWQQADEVRGIFRKAGLCEIVTVRDYGDRDRVVLGQKRQG